MKKVSVIIPIHNSEKYLEECIDSVINQTYKELEIIVVDDHSIDSSLSIIKKKNDHRVKIYSLKENNGASYARNLGIKKSTGDYICFIDSDDYWLPNKIEKQLAFIEENNYTFIYDNYLYLKKGKTKKAKVPKSLDYKQALKNTAIFTSTVMLNMKHLSKDDIYMPHIKRGQDAATWWQILKKGITAYNVDETLSIYRVGEKSLSHNKIIALNRTWNLYKREDINYLKKIEFFICYIYNAIKRRL